MVLELVRNQPEEKQVQKETARAQGAFNEYLHLGPTRTVQQLAKHLRKSSKTKAPSIRTLYEWSRLFNWLERAKEWDAKQAERAEDVLVDVRVKELEGRHKSRLEIVDMMKTSARQYLMEPRLTDDGHPILDSDGNEIWKLKPIERMEPAACRNALSMLDLAFKNERLDTGQPTDRRMTGSPAEFLEVSEIESKPVTVEPITPEREEELRNGLGRLATRLEKAIELKLFDEDLKRERGEDG